MSAEAAESGGSGLKMLQECVELILSEVRALKAARPRSAEDQTRPLTALELCERWHVVAGTPALQLLYLARKCRAWGLRPLQGTEGWGALYMPAAVRRAEEFASGGIRSRAVGSVSRKPKMKGGAS